MYKLFNHPRDNVITSVYRTDLDGQVWSIPFAPDNTDYANFKKEILADEAQLQNADGVLMSADEAQTYVRSLP